MKTAIAIPIYKNNPSKSELASLIQCASVLNGYDLYFLTYEDIDFSEYKIIDKYKNDYKFAYFEAENFSGVQSYSQLCLNPDLYKRFSQYDYMFIYQLDGWVFKDELGYWSNQGYDYIGAPWFEGFSDATNSSKFMVPSGNGGVSLRKIDKFIHILSGLNEIENMRLYDFKHFRIYNKNPLKQIIKYFAKSNLVKNKIKKTNEDYIIVRCFNKIDETFSIAPPEIAMHFSFEVLPERLYEMSGHKLPFACHAWEKYGKDFYKEFIKISDF